MRRVVGTDESDIGRWPVQPHEDLPPLFPHRIPVPDRVPTGGVGGRLRQPMQLQHDLAVTAVYIARQKDTPEDETWVGEDAYRVLLHPRALVKVPDALIVDQQHKPRRVVELGGMYGPRRLRGFHRYWASRRIPYEIW